MFQNLEWTNLYFKIGLREFFLRDIIGKLRQYYIDIVRSPRPSKLVYSRFLKPPLARQGPLTPVHDASILSPNHIVAGAKPPAAEALAI